MRKANICFGVLALLAAACSADPNDPFAHDELMESEGDDPEFADGAEGADNELAEEVQEKWMHSTAFGWKSGEVTYSVSFPPGVTQVGQLTTAQAITVVDSAFQQWDPKVNLSFRKVNPGSAVLEVTFVPTANINGRLGFGLEETIFIASDVNWGTTDLNLTNVMLHEIGHSLALEHSSVNSTTGAIPMMSRLIEAPGAVVQGFSPDDMQAIAASPYVSWQGVSSSEGSKDIGSSVSGGTEHTWKLGSGTNSEGFKVHRWIESSSSWLQITGGGVRIDMAGMVAWVVTNLGKAKEKAGVSSGSPNGLGWTDRGNCGFVDIGANGAGTVWAVGSGTAGVVTGDANGDFNIYRHSNGSGNTCSGWTLVTGKKARYIDVAPDGSAWVVTNAGAIWHQTGTNTWTEIRADIVYLPGTIARARDIAVGPEAWAAESNVWITGHPSQNDYIFALNRQTNAGGVVAQNNWTRTWAGGNAVFLSVGKNSLPWAIASDSTTWRLRP